MLIVVTGVSGVGKTSILQSIDNWKVINMDEFIWNNFYKSDHLVYKKIVTIFGKNILSNNKIDKAKLGSIVFNNDLELKKLDKILLPYIQEFFNDLKKINQNFIIEMATYIHYENYFKDIFDVVILIDRRKPILKDKFNYLKNKKNPIQLNKIKFNYKVDNSGLLEKSIKQFKNIIYNL